MTEQVSVEKAKHSKSFGIGSGGALGVLLISLVDFVPVDYKNIYTLLVPSVAILASEFFTFVFNIYKVDGKSVRLNRILKKKEKEILKQLNDQHLSDDHKERLRKIYQGIQISKLDPHGALSELQLED